MKTLIVLLFSLAVVSCNQGDTIQAAAAATAITGANDPLAANAAGGGAPVDSTRLHALQLLAGDIRPGNNHQTFDCLDSLRSRDSATRQFYFSVFRKIISKADGALGEVVGSYAKTYLQQYPAEFANQFSNMTTTQKADLVDYLGFQFYSSYQDYKTGIQQFFSKTIARCRECGDGEKALLAGLQAEITASIGRQLQAQEH